MENPTLKNVLIVESFNDSAFVRLLLHDLGLSAKTQTEIIDLHKFPDPDNPEKTLRGKDAISGKLKSFKGDLLNREQYKEVERLGILLDFDNETLDRNLNRVNKAIEGAFGEQPKLTGENAFAQLDIKASGVSFALNTACFFTKDSSGTGNLDTLLFEVCRSANLPVPYADCLEHWRDCVNGSSSLLKVSPGLFTKMWVSNFFRAKAREFDRDILKDFEEKQSLLIQQHGSKMFDLKHEGLSSLRDFLASFKPQTA